MPRHVKSKASTGPKAVIRRRSWKVSRNPVQTPVLVDIGVSHPMWTDTKFKGLSEAVSPGDIVKLTPPPGTDEIAVGAMERACYTAGAVTVKVMPTQDEVKVTVEGETFDFSTDIDDSRSLRQVAIERARRVTNASDPAALEALVNLAMDKAEARS